jgi:hypothetical protein
MDLEGIGNGLIEITLHLPGDTEENHKMPQNTIWSCQE